MAPTVVVGSVETDSANRNMVMAGDEFIEVAGIACRGDKDLCIETLMANRSNAPVQCTVLRTVAYGVEVGAGEAIGTVNALAA